MRWEYVWAMGRIDAPDDVLEQLKTLGRAGWEAIGLTQPREAPDHVTVLLKRRYRPRRPTSATEPAMTNAAKATVTRCAREVM